MYNSRCLARVRSQWRQALSPSHASPYPRFSHHLLVGVSASLIFSASMAAGRKKKDALWAKEKDLDCVIQTERKVKEVTEIIHLLEQQEEHLLSLYDLRNYWRYVGAKGMRRFRILVKKYPGIFRCTVDDEREPWVDLTDEAEQLLQDEKAAKEGNKPLLAEKLRKLLMMSVDRRLKVEKLSHLKHMLGFPDEFRHRFLCDFPEYFHVVETGAGPYLELKAWDPLLAITAREKALKAKLPIDKAAPIWKDSHIFSPVDDAVQELKHEFEIRHPKGGTPGRREWERILRFQLLPFPSPYETAANLDPESLEAEKRTVGVIHEFLSLAIDKKSLVSRIALFKNELSIPDCSEAFLERHPGIFYVSHKGDHHIVFLKEGYKGAEVLEKNPLLLLNEHLVQLMKIRPKHQLRQSSDSEDDQYQLSGKEQAQKFNASAPKFG